MLDRTDLENKGLSRAAIDFILSQATHRGYDGRPVLTADEAAILLDEFKAAGRDGED